MIIDLYSLRLKLITVVFSDQIEGETEYSNYLFTDCKVPLTELYKWNA